MTVFDVLFVRFIIFFGFYNGNATNLVKLGGSASFGVQVVLGGAAIVHYSYIGHDPVSTMAEENILIYYVFTVCQSLVDE